ncbi:hypothetical protein LZF96_21460 [Streptomyces sp. ST2-7A]|nr:hypothetical protein [Streptomyces sp. ST2-7A]MCE7082643.1 hypothetical protein [Streptomyces sp. ST2-7A]
MFDRPLAAPERDRYRREQREAVLRALGEYAPDAMAVFDVDLGHTDPQLVVPVGGPIRVDGPAHRITVTYRPSPPRRPGAEDARRSSAAHRSTRPGQR